MGNSVLWRVPVAVMVNVNLMGSLALAHWLLNPDIREAKRGGTRRMRPAPEGGDHRTYGRGSSVRCE